MGRGRKPRAVHQTVEDGPPVTVVSRNKEDGNVPQPETPAEQKLESKHLGSVRRSQRLQSPAAAATPPPGSLDVEPAERLMLDFTVVEGDEEEGGNVPQPETLAEQLLGAAMTVNGAKKSESKHLGSVRRSQRLQCPAAVVTPPPGSLDAERLIQDITVVEEEEDGKELPQQGHAAHEMGLKERCDYMEQMLQEHKRILEGSTNPKGTKRNFSGETALEGEMSYKNLYIESQKKVEALMEENQQLIRELEKTHGQIEVYEKLMNAITITSLAKTKETALNVNEATCSPYINQDTGNGKNAKRKKEANGY